MIGRSDEIIRQLNRLANDRTLNMHARNKIREATHHIQELHEIVGRIKDLHLKLSKKRNQAEIPEDSLDHAVLRAQWAQQDQTQTSLQ